MPDGSANVVQSSDDGGSDAQAAITQTVGAAGGTVSAQGLSLAIPAGALAADTDISITPGLAAPPAGYTALSTLYTFGPDGTVFLKPVTVSFPLTNAGTNPTIFWSNADGGYDALSTISDGMTATASVMHFSRGFVGEARHDGGDSGMVADAAASDDAGPREDASTGDSGTGSDAAASAGDAATGLDSGASVDASAVVDAGQAGDSGAGAIDDAGSGGSSDAMAAADGGINGITVNIDGNTTPTVFASNAYVLQGSILQADDNTTPNHWRLMITLSGTASEACNQGSAYPQIVYTHYTNNSPDETYYSNQWMGYCTISVSSFASQPGQHAKGTFIAGVDLPREGGAPDGASPIHGLNGSFDVVF